MASAASSLTITYQGFTFHVLSKGALRKSGMGCVRLFRLGQGIREAECGDGQPVFGDGLRTQLELAQQLFKECGHRETELQFKNGISLLQRNTCAVRTKGQVR